jgi:pimeloyl-ACP methyl ester carboxylesterase
MLYYKTFQEGATQEWVIFVHGAGGSSSIWFKQVREYIKHFNVLLIDLRGHGKSAEVFSDASQKTYSFQDISRDVIEVVEHLKIAQAHFVGISLGTIIIRTIGEIKPEIIKSMILGGAVTRLNLRSRFLVLSAKLTKKYIPFIWLYSICAHILMPSKRHKESRSMFIREAKRLAKAEFLRWFVLTTEINPLLKYFEEKDLKIPTLYLMGDGDYMFLPAATKIVKEHIFSVLKIIKNSGHVCNIDQPEEFNDFSINFIHRLSAQNNEQEKLLFMKNF